MIYLRLFWEFFKTGLFSVGGGLATLPFIYDMSDRTGWFTYQQIADMVAVSESTPGPIGVNTATYVGYITGGVPGALVATLGLVTPTTANAPKRPKSCLIFSFIAIPQRSGPPAKAAGGPGHVVSIQPRSVSANCA